VRLGFALTVLRSTGYFLVLARLPADAAAAGAHRETSLASTAWRQCRQLRGSELFLLSAINPTSFDSRYFGSLAASAVIDSAQPLWTQSTP